MQNLQDLQSIGFQLPTPAYIFGAIVFGVIGFVAYRHGRKSDQPMTLWLGVALMVYPYVVTGTWMLYAVGIALCAALYFSANASR